ncbi:lytic polysaccharide monooxygenase auxiliary activity family 9 protein [Kitasatospora aureofaciens]|uniref:lytic polysaccharide monooxygenase auxiliary activity family 9 protein n=1 Tax=Kitasatospora aureofaciens TaxID=1894 RepID=UPI0033D8F5FC
MRRAGSGGFELHSRRRTVINSRRNKVLAVACGTLPLLLLGMAGKAQAHGSMQNPISRVYGCNLEGPEHPKSAACQAAVAASGTQAFYDWMGVRIGDAAGRHRELIPDGKLCSAGNDEYKGLDLPRADWAATSLPASGSFTFRYRGTAPHRGSFELYVTKDGYDPTKPLKWSDLEPTPFYKATDPSLVDGSYQMTAQLPKKQGRHLIYAIWQRSDSPEAFYSCSDVVFGGAGSSSAPGTASNPGTAPGAGTAPGKGSGQGAGSTAGAASGSGGTSGTGAGAGAAKPSAAGSNSDMDMSMDHGSTSSPAGGSAQSGDTSQADSQTGFAAGSTPTDSSTQLAHTGGSNIVPLTVGATAVLGAGGATLFLARRRRSHRRG